MTSTVPAEHVLTPDDRCPCGQPQTGSGYCSYECYSKHEPEPASMGGPLSEAERPPLSDEELALMERLWAPHQTYVRDLLDEVYRLRAENDVLKAAPQILASPDKAKRIASLVASSTRLVQIERDDARARVGVLEGQLATARELHKPERRYTPDDGETSYATYAEAADASFTGFGTPVSVTFFEVCSHCASIEMAEGCDHQYKESLWPCDDAVALGLDGGDPDA